MSGRHQAGVSMPGPAVVEDQISPRPDLLLHGDLWDYNEHSFGVRVKN